MRKLLLSSLFISLFVLFSNSANASWVAAGEISYTHVGGNNYEVVFTKYRDCDYSTGAISYMPIKFECDSNPNLSYYDTLPIFNIPHPIVTTNCPSSPSKCSNGSSYGVEEVIYRKTVTLNPCHSWTISINFLCRNFHSSTEDSLKCFYTEVQLNNLDGLHNNSVKFDFTPIHIIPNNEKYTIYQGATDSDGDSLVFSFYTPKHNGSTDMTYNLPWTVSNFLTALPTGILFDSTNGDISFTPNHSGYYNFSTLTGIKIEEYRIVTGTPILIGTTRRDIEITVLIYSTNKTPTLSGIDTSLASSYNPNDSIYEIAVPINLTPISFNIYGHDMDTFNYNNYNSHPERFSISWDNSISGANFTTFYNGTDSAYANFSWSPNSSDIGKKKCFFVTITDEACPYNAVQHFRYCILVKPSNVGINKIQENPNPFIISQNRPNPAHDITTFDIQLEEPSHIIIEVRNMLGQTVFEKNYGNLSSGGHEIQINLINIKAGIYFYTVYADQNSKTRKLIVE